MPYRRARDLVHAKARCLRQPAYVPLRMRIAQAGPKLQFLLLCRALRALRRFHGEQEAAGRRQQAADMPEHLAQFADVDEDIRGHHQVSRLLRRGRHSRPGFEKFPSLEAMLACFPPSAESCVILGGDNFLLPRADATEHWTIFRFRELPLADFFDRIDFHVYFTNPLWREGFGRVIAEAIAAGKVVLTDPGTAEAFGDAVVGCEPDEVDDVIAGFIREPRRYQRFVRAAQASLGRFGPEAFRARVLANLDRCLDTANALL